MGGTTSSRSPSRAPILLRPRNFQWYWKSAAADAGSLSSQEWTKFKDIDNEIIEDALNTKKRTVKIDGGCVVNLTQKTLQVKCEQYPIKRFELERNRTTSQLREERFACPVPLISTTTTTTEADSMFIGFVHTIPNAYYDRELRGKHKTVAFVVGEAAKGILTEGTALEKAEEAKWLAEQLLVVKHLDQRVKITIAYQTPTLPAPIGDTCINLYTRGSFWYTLLNRIMREQKTLTLEQLMTVGPFAYLLKWYIYGEAPHEPLTVYRGLTLSEEERKEFLPEEGRHLTLKAFTSTSKNRAVAEMFSGNTLLVIEVQRNYFLGGHIAELSVFPDEEEVLVLPGTALYLVNYEYDNESQRHVCWYKIWAPSKPETLSWGWVSIEVNCHDAFRPSSNQFLKTSAFFWSGYCMSFAKDLSSHWMGMVGSHLKMCLMAEFDSIESLAIISSPLGRFSLHYLIELLRQTTGIGRFDLFLLWSNCISRMNHRSVGRSRWNHSYLHWEALCNWQNNTEIVEIDALMSHLNTSFVSALSDCCSVASK